MDKDGVTNKDHILNNDASGYRLLFKNNHTAMLLVDPSSLDIVDINKAACNYFSVSPEEITRKKVFEIPALPEEEIRSCVEKANSKAQSHFFFEYQSKNGDKRNIGVCTIPIKIAGQELLCLDIHDITRVKKAEKELDFEKARLKSLVEILQYRYDSFQDFLDYALNEAIKLTQSKIGYIYYYDENQKEFILNTWSKDVMKECTITDPQTIYKLEKTGIWGEAVRQRKTITVNDFQAANPLKKGYPEGHVKLCSYMTVPIFKNEEIVAVVGVANKESDYSENDENQLTLLMNSVWNIIQQRKTEEALQQSEEHMQAYNLMQAVLESPNDVAIFALDRAYRYIVFNKDHKQIMEQRWGTTIEAGAGMLSYIKDPEVRKRAKQNFDRALAGEAFTFVEDYKHSPLKIQWFENVYSPLRDPEGNITGITAIISDITELKQVEEALRESEKKYRGLFENNISGVVITKIITNKNGYPVDFVFQEVNNEFEKHTGLKAEDVVGKRVTEVYLGIEKREDTFLDLHRNVALTGVPASTEMYSEELRKYFSINAYRIEENVVIGVFQDITERKEIEKELTESREKYQMLSGATFEGIIFHEKGIVLDANDAVTRITGYTKEELLGNDIIKMISHPDDICISEEQMKKAIAKPYEIRGIRKDGTLFPVEIESYRTNYKGRQVRVAAIRDVTERKQAEEELKLVSDRLMLATRAGGVGIWDLDIVNNTLVWDDQMFSLYGIKREDFGSTVKDWQTRVHPDDFERSDTEAKMALRGEKEYDVEFRIVWPDGTFRNIRSLAIILRDEAGDPVRMIGTNWDITSQKKAEEELRAKNEEIERYFTFSLELLCIANTKGEFVRLNPGWENVLGYSIDELEGHEFMDFVHPDDVKNTNDAMSRLDKQEPVLNFVNRYRARDGSYRWIEWQAVPKENLIYAAARDITQRKFAEEKLLEYAYELEDKNTKLDDALLKAEEATRAKSEFLANMSHEIRTPMNGVIGMTSLLLDTDLDKQQKHYVETVQISGEVLLELINDILDISKIEAGKIELEKLDIDLNDILEETAPLLSARIEDKELELLCTIDPDVPSNIKADPTRLKQVLTNLGSNAIKFSHKGKVTIRVSLESETESQATLLFSVKDTGIGIPEDKKDLLFKNFSQADTSTSRKYGGTGLGLTISKKLVELMGGEIGFESEEGKGSEFWFKVSFDKHLGELAKKKESKELDGIRVLVVDDDIASRKTLTTLLNSWNMDVKEVADGTLALNILFKSHASGEPFQMALLDMQMSGMDGMLLGHIIRSDKDLKDTSLIMLSSSEQGSDTPEQNKDDFDAYITKPVIKSELFKKLCEVSVKERSGMQIDLNKDARILLVEDNVVNQHVAQGILQKLGITADVSNNGLEAIEALETVKYDLIFMDVQMPEMDGMEATRLIRNKESSVLDHDVPIIAMTAHAMKGDKESCMEAGMSDYISKPIKLKSVSELLKRWVGEAIGNETADNSHEETVTESLIFDKRSFLDDIVGDIEIAKKVIGIFLKTTPNQLLALKEAVDEKDADAIANCAHSIKGSSVSVGGIALSDIAAKIEQQAIKGELDNAQEELKELEEQYKLLIKELNKL